MAVLHLRSISHLLVAPPLAYSSPWVYVMVGGAAPAGNAGQASLRATLTQPRSHQPPRWWLQDLQHKPQMLHLCWTPVWPAGFFHAVDSADVRAASATRVDRALSSSFPVQHGVAQGRPLLPSMNALFID